MHGGKLKVELLCLSFGNILKFSMLQLKYLLLKCYSLGQTLNVTRQHCGALKTRFISWQAQHLRTGEFRHFINQKSLDLNDWLSLISFNVYVYFLLIASTFELIWFVHEIKHKAMKRNKALKGISAVRIINFSCFLYKVRNRRLKCC